MRQRALARARIVVGGLVAVPFAAAAIVAVAGGSPRETNLDVPAALAALVALPVAWRAHAALAERARRADDEARRCAGLVVAIAVAASVTCLGATIGVGAFAASRDPMPLVGLAMHAILARALWPTRERLDAFLDEARRAAP